MMPNLVGWARRGMMSLFEDRRVQTVDYSLHEVHSEYSAPAVTHNSGTSILRTCELTLESDSESRVRKTWPHADL